MASKFSIFKNAYRALFKPGVGGVSLPLSADNSNVSPCADNLGSTWVRDASKPVYFFDSSNPGPTTPLGYAQKQRWTTALGQNFLLVSQDNNTGVPGALYHVLATFGDPNVPWAADPYYLQIHTPFNLNTQPLPGAVPSLSVPCPRPNEGAGRAEIVFGTDTPFNLVQALGGGACICISSAPDTFTAPAVNAGQISASWAYYSYTI